MEQSSTPHSTSQSNTQTPSGLTVLSPLKRAFSITDVVLRILGLMTLADGRIAWTGLFRGPVEFYAAVVRTGATSLERLVGVRVPESLSFYLPIAIVFFVGINLAFRQAHGRTLVWNALVDAPRIVADKLPPGVARRLIVRLLMTFWGAFLLVACLILGPIAILTPAVGTLVFCVVASVAVLLMTLLAASMVFHTTLFGLAVFGFMWLGVFIGSVTAEQELRGNARLGAQQILTGFRDILGFLKLTWSGAITAWKRLAVEVWQGFISGPWEAKRIGYLRAQYLVALSVVVMLALLSSAQALRKIVGLP